MPSTRPTVDPVLDILEELGYDFDELDGDGYKRSLKEAIIKLTIKDAKDPRIEPLTLELQKVKGSRKVEPKEKPKEKRTTIRGDKLMGREPKKDAPSPTADKPKLLPGSGKFNTDDVKPVDVDKDKNKKKDSSGLNPDKLDSIAKTVESIALLLRRQFKLEKKQQRDSRRQQSKADRDAREDKLEAKPEDKKTGGLPKAITKPALSFFDKIKKFFFNIVLGASVVKIMEWLKDPDNQVKIAQFKDFLIDNAPLIVGALAGLALLPVVSSLVGMVGGIMGGLSMLGLAVPLLPIILKGILIAAVAALAIAAVNWFSKKIVGGKDFKRARDLNKKLLERKGMSTSGDVSMDGQGVWADIFGKNSVMGREWTDQDKTYFPNKDERVRINLKQGSVHFSKWGKGTTISEEKHREWFAENYGQEALDQKLSAHEQYTTTKASIISRKEEMDQAIKDKNKEFQSTLKDRKAAALKKVGIESTGYWDQLKERARSPEEYDARVKRAQEILNNQLSIHNAEKRAITNRYNKEAMQIFNESKDSNVNIDKNIKTDTNNISASTKKGGVTIIDGGNGTSGGNTSGGSGGDDGQSDDNFSSEDPNDLTVLACKATYNLGAA